MSSMTSRRSLHVLGLMVASLLSSFASAWCGTENPKIHDGCSEFAFGVDLSMDGVSCSMTFPNFTTIPLVYVEGHQDYLKTMDHFFQITEEAATRSTCPLDQLNHTFEADAGVDLLARTVSRARLEAEQLLQQRYGIDLAGCRTYTLTTVPTFLGMSAPGFETGDESCDIHAFVGRKIWQSVNDGGFSLPPSQAGADLFGNQYRMYTSLAGQRACCSWPVGACDDMLEDWEPKEYCLQKGRFVIVADMSSSMLSLWAVGLNACDIKPSPWATYPELAVQSFSNRLERYRWATIVATAVVELTGAVIPGDIELPTPVVLTIGQGWDQTSITALKFMLELRGIDVLGTLKEQRVHLASLGAAYVAQVRNTP